MSFRISQMPLLGVNWQFTRRPASNIIKQSKLSLLMLVTLVLTMALTIVAPEQALFYPLKMQPQLAQMARLTPDQPVSVIVQKNNTLADVENQIARLGGVVTKDLSIIHAFAATVPAGSLLTLERNSEVRWVSIDSPAISQGTPGTAVSSNHYRDEVKANNLLLQDGSGIGIAILDSGIQSASADFKGRIVAQQKATTASSTVSDNYGHGTFVAGVAAGDGSTSGFDGVAPGAKIISVKVTDDSGKSLASDVVSGMQWVLNNKNTYNIRVVNLSMNSGTLQSYNVDPLCAAAEILWFNGIVVVVAAGNNGSANLYPPANDPFVITVGALDDHGTSSVTDDTMTTFSAWGKDETGGIKPDIVAPGRNLIAPLASSTSGFAKNHSGNILSKNASYFVMSGTSAATPVVAGAVALLLQAQPWLNPDQVKYRLKSSALQNRGRDWLDIRTKWPGYNATTAGAGLLDIDEAINNSLTFNTANTGLPVSKLLTTGSNPVAWGSVNWSSVSWSTVNWSSVSWSTVNWSSVNWSSAYFD